MEPIVILASNPAVNSSFHIVHGTIYKNWTFKEPRMALFHHWSPQISLAGSIRGYFLGQEGPLTYGIVAQWPMWNDTLLLKCKFQTLYLSYSLDNV